MEQSTQQGQYPVRPIAEKWYVRAGIKTKNAFKRALLPTAIAVGMAVTGYVGFETGRTVATLQMGGFFEEILIEERVQRSITRRGDRFYIHEEREIDRMITLDELVQEQQPSGDNQQYAGPYSF